jgi:hypothetical protein
MHTFTTFFHKKAEASRIRFSLAIVVVCKEPAVDLRNVKKNHTEFNRIDYVDKKDKPLPAVGGYLHK